MMGRSPLSSDDVSPTATSGGGCRRLIKLVLGGTNQIDITLFEGIAARLEQASAPHGGAVLGSAPLALSTLHVQDVPALSDSSDIRAADVKHRLAALLDFRYEDDESRRAKMTALREKERLRREAERVDATDDGDGM